MPLLNETTKSLVGSQSSAQFKSALVSNEHGKIKHAEEGVPDHGAAVGEAPRSSNRRHITRQTNSTPERASLFFSYFTHTYMREDLGVLENYTYTYSVLYVHRLYMCVCLGVVLLRGYVVMMNFMLIDPRDIANKSSLARSLASEKRYIVVQV